jgi:hypothetical protein
VPLKSPLEEYEEFLATCPGWVRWRLGVEPFQPEYQEQWATSNLDQVAAFDARFFELLARLPKKRKEWERRAGRVLSRGRILVKKGRPRKDAEAAEIARLRDKPLRDRTKTYGEIAVALKRPGEEKPPTADSVRKLHKSRKVKSTGEKSD